MAIQISLEAQAPINDTIIGTVDLPNPRKPPVNESIIPHRKYGQHTQNRRSVPAAIASALSVYIPSNGAENVYARFPSTNPTTVTIPRHSKITLRTLFSSPAP